MKQKISEQHTLDANGNPTGGSTVSVGVSDYMAHRTNEENAEKFS